MNAVLTEDISFVDPYCCRIESGLCKAERRVVKCECDNQENKQKDKIELHTEDDKTVLYSVYPDGIDYKCECLVKSEILK